MSGIAPIQLTKPPTPPTKPPRIASYEPLICPRCTAPYDGHHCEYCGTMFAKQSGEKPQAILFSLMDKGVITRDEAKKIATDTECQMKKLLYVR